MSCSVVMAESWELKEDQRTWIFKLRRGIRWRDSDRHHDAFLVHDDCGRDALDAVGVAHGLTEAIQSHPRINRRSLEERGHKLLVLVRDGDESDGLALERVCQMVPVRDRTLCMARTTRP